VDEPQFVSIEEVYYLHSESLARFGGSDGVREPGLIESALGSAINTWHYAHGDLFDIAAAYAFHLAESQAFVDGNKRTAVAAALTFLGRNGFRGIIDDGSIYEAMIAIAKKELDKKGLSQVFRKLARKG
jgi:death-on-curing protein